WLRIVEARANKANTNELARLLRARRERPRGNRAAEQRDEVATPHGLFPKARDYGNIAGQGAVYRSKKGRTMTASGHRRRRCRNRTTLHVRFASKAVK